VLGNTLIDGWMGGVVTGFVSLRYRASI